MSDTYIHVKPAIEVQFHKCMERGRVLFFSAPCGFGKTVTAEKLIRQTGKRYRSESADRVSFEQLMEDPDWELLFLDDLQLMQEEEELQALCSLIRDNPDRRFILASRGLTPGCLMAFQYTGLMTVLHADALLFDREDIRKIFQEWGVPVTDSELGGIAKESIGHPLGVIITIVSDKKELIQSLIQDGSLTAEEMSLLAEGGSIELVLNVERVDTAVSTDTKAAMEKAAGEFTIGQYLDITLTKSVNGKPATEIHEINVPIKIALRLSGNLLNTDSKMKCEYMVLRNHAGEVVTLEGTYADGVIIFETDRFSDYAVAWKDTAVSSPAKKDNSGGSQQDKPAVSKLAQVQGVPTGDNAAWFFYVLAFIISMAGIAGVVWRKRKMDRTFN